MFARGIANTRMRDFYDIYEITITNKEKINKSVLFKAFHTTCEKRETIFTKHEMTDIFEKIVKDGEMNRMWEQFRQKNYFVGDLQWKEVIRSVGQTIEDFS